MEDENTTKSSSDVDDVASSKTGSESVTGSLEEQLEAAVAERDENHDRWLRTQADLENYRKRVSKEADENRKYQAVGVIRDLLPGLDNLGRAVEAAQTSGNVDELVQGVQMVLKQFEDILSAHSAVVIEAVGQPFDPNLHEALQQVPSADHPPMTVVQELERGFQIHDRVVRPSKVIVSSGPPAETGDSAES